MKKIAFKIQDTAKIFKYVSFVLAALLIAYLTPIGGSQFEFDYSKGKPWQYELLTAPYDFPIYKDAIKVKHEQDSIRQATLPVYTYEGDVALLMLDELKGEYESSLKDKVTYPSYDYLVKSIKNLYQRGLIAQSNVTQLRSQGHQDLRLLEQANVLERTPIERFYTLKEAYEYILENAPKNVPTDELKAINLSNYLKPNVSFNEALTEKMINDEVQKNPLSMGLVQRGERIIDKGDIVTPYIDEVLVSLSKEDLKRSGLSTLMDQLRIRLSMGACLAIIFLLLAIYLSKFMPKLFVGYKNVAFWLILISLFVGLTAYNESHNLFNHYAIPYVMIIILIRTFFDSHTALVLYMTTIISAAFFVPDPLIFLALEFIVGMVALIVLQNLSSRGRLMNVAFLIFLTYTLVYLALMVMKGEEINANYWLVEVDFAINFILLVFTYGLAFAIERVFGYVSNVTLVELSDMNTPLLRELSETAPGTFQHSLQVSILATSAAEVIGGNVPLLRAGALYHDIGKLKNPSYFTENQGKNNPHNLLGYKESAAIIIRHVTDGIIMAQKHGLPKEIIDFIRTHHGEGVTGYFYTKYCNEHPDEEVDKKDFQYPGPNPWTIEQGILMLADAVEASSRSLPEHTEESIRNLMVKVVDGIVASGLLNETPLTFKDIVTIKSIFLNKLKIIYHSRISYPEKK